MAATTRTPEENAHLMVWLRATPFDQIPKGWALDEKCYHDAKISRIRLSGDDESIAWKRKSLMRLAHAQDWRRLDGSDGIVLADGMRVEEFVSYFSVRRDSQTAAPIDAHGAAR